MSHGFFQREVLSLPHPPIPLAIFLIVESAMREAWRRLRLEPPSRIDLQTAEEDKITHEFFEILFDDVFNEGVVDGFDSERFSVVVRESKISNFDKAALDKMPDLLVGLAGREAIWKRSQDYLFVECKPVGLSRSVGVHYGAKGIARFIRGDYAWAMPNALMVGYNSPGYEIVPKLFESLKKRAVEFEVKQHPAACKKSLSTAFSAPVHITSHNRCFSYLENGQPAPPIQLRHLWLSRS